MQNINMTEKEMVNDLLFSEKKMTSNYDIYSNEADNTSLRNELHGILNSEHEIHDKIYNTMKQKGWYNLSNASSQDIQKAKQNFENMKNQL